MAFRQIKSPALANQAVINTKLDVTAVAGQTAAPSVASLSNDTLLMHSAGDNALRKLSVANLFGSITTDNLAEGSTNLFFTDARAQSAVAQDIADAVAAEAAIRSAADATLTSDLADEVARATAAEGTLTTNLANEITRATARENAIEVDYQAADANIQTQIDNILNNVDPAALDSLAEIVAAYQAADDVFTAGIAANATAISTETSRAQGAEAALQASIDSTQAELDVTQTAAGLAADGSFVAYTGTNYINSATTLAGTNVLLDSAIKAEETARIAADTAHTNDITALDGRVTTNEGDIVTLDAGLTQEIADRIAGDAALSTSLQAEINARVTAVQGAKDYADAQDALLIGDATVDGTAGNTITDRIATSLASAQTYADTAEADAIATANAYTDTRETAITTAYQTYADTAEADAITAANAYTDTKIADVNSSLSTSVSTLEAADTDLQTQINNILNNTDPAAIDSFTEVVAAFEAADSSLNGLISANQTAITNEATTRASADTTLQANIDSEAATRAAADTTLQTNIDTEEAARILADSNLQAELDATQAGAGLNADGTYSALTGANYISAATSMKDADNKLDAALKAESDARIAADISINNAIGANTANIATNATDIDNLETALAGETSRAQSAEATLQGNIDTLSSEVDSTQVGAGLSADGSYVANASANYINTAVSLKDADNKLDAAIKVNADAIATETQNRIDAVSAEAATRLSADNTLQANIDNEATARIAADNALDARVTTNEGDIATLQSGLTTETSNRVNGDLVLQGKIDTVESSAGLSVDGAYVADATKTYINDATTLFNADQQLDDAIVAEVARATAAEGALDGRVTTLEGEMDTAQADIVSNTNAITAEVTRATGAESALDARLTTEEGNVDSLQAFTGEGTVLDTSATDLAGAVNEIVAALGTSEAGLTVEINNVEGSLGTAVNADGTFAGYTGTNYIDTAVSMTDADVKLDAAIKTTDARVDALLQGTTTDFDTFVEVVNAFQAADSTINGAITQLAADSTAARSAIQAELDATQVSVGSAVNADGTFAGYASTNYINAATSMADADVKLDAAIKVNADGLAAEITRATGAESTLQGNIDAEAATRLANDNTLQGNIDAEAATRLANDNTLQSNIDAEATARATADTALADDLTAKLGDATVDGTAGNTVSDRIATALSSAQSYADTAEADAITAANAYTDGLIATEHQHHIDGDAATLASAQAYADTAEADAIASSNAYTDARETAITTAYQAYADQAEADAITSSNAYTDTRETAIRTDFVAGDAAVTTAFQAADTLIQQELDATQTGAGLGTDGTYTANASANYISAAVSLKDADNKLDAALKAEETARTTADTTLQTNIDTEAATRLSADNTLQANINAEATTRANADAALDTRVTNLETEMTATQTGAGLATDGTYTANAAANYINTAVSLKDADNKLDAAIKAEETRATGEEARIEGRLDAEITRATTAEGNLATSIQAVADDLAQELLDRAAADANLQGQIDFIVSNTDAAALDSITEVVAAFQDADTNIVATVNSNTTAINNEITRATDAEAALQTAINDEEAARIAADNTLQANIDGKVAKAGDTMSGVLNMGSNQIQGLANGTLATDAVNKGQLDAGLAAQHISVFSTDDLAEGTNLYYTDARSRAAISVVDVEGNGDFSYNATTGVISADLSKSFLELTDVTDADYVGKADYVAVVNATEDGIELVHASELQIFGQTYRQVIDGDGSSTTFALDFLADSVSTLVFVGGVIQDPTTHYTIDNVNQTITFTAALPLGTQAVVVARELVGASPFIGTGSISSDKLESTIAVGTRSGDVASSTTGSVVDSFDGTAYRSAKYLIQVNNGAGEFETREALVIHDGTTAYITEFAMVYTGAGLLGDASVQMNGTNVELVYTANAAGTTVKVISTYIEV